MRMSKRRNKKITQKAFRRMAFSSALGILACIICLAGMTWAWFTDSLTSTGNTIESSGTSALVSVSPVSEKSLLKSMSATRAQYEEVEHDSVGIFDLPKGSEYNIVLVAGGTASKGYYRVKIGDDTYFTDTMYLGQAVSFTVDCTGNGTVMEITPYWMDNLGESNLHDGMKIDMGGHEEENEDDTAQPAAGDSGSADKTTEGTGAAEADNTSATSGSAPVGDIKSDEGKDTPTQSTEETTTQPEADNETEAAGTSGESGTDTDISEQQE